MNHPEKDVDKSNSSLQISDRVRLFRRGRVWNVNFQADGRQHRQSLKTTSMKEARRLAMRLASDLESGRWKESLDAVSVAEAIAAYRDFLLAEGRAAKTMTKYEKVFERVVELAGERKVRDLSGIDLKFVDAFRRMRVDAGAAPKTHYTEAVVIRQLVNFALSRDMITIDPLKRLKLKKPKPTPQPCWTHEQVAAILAASPAEVKAAFTLLAELGIRFGELAWLTPEDVELATNVVRIRPKEGWKPKTGDQRAIPLSPLVLEVLELLPKRWKWLVTMPPSKQSPQLGRQWTERRLLAALKKVLKQLHLPGKLHTFRHTFISNAAMNGVPEAVIREWVGHVDEQILRHYTHVHSEASQEAMKRMVEKNLRSQEAKKSQTRMVSDSAQIQHNPEEDGNEKNAK